MKKQNKLSLWICATSAVFLLIISCNKKYDGTDSSVDIIRNATNKKTYSKTKLDSIQAINVITNQKIQDLLDLSALYTSGNKDTEIDSVIYEQMQAHFLVKDSGNLKPVLKEMDSLKVRFVKVNNLKINKLITEKDTLDFANFNVDYYDNKRNFITTAKRKAQYVLKPSPVQFKKEFKFYFVDFYKKESDTATKNHSKH